MKVRADAKERERRKRRGTTEKMRQDRELRIEKKRARATARRWLGRRCGAVGGLRAGGQASAPSAPLEAFAPSATRGRRRKAPLVCICFEGQPAKNLEDVLSRRDFHVVYEWPKALKMVNAGTVKAANVIFVVKCLNGDTVATNDTAMACVALGGVLIAAKWLDDAIRAKPPEPPPGVQYSGIGKQQGSRVLTIAFSAALEERRDKTCNLLKFMPR